MTVDIFQGHDFVRKQFPVQAVQVTPNNIDQLAEIVKGDVKHDGDKEAHFSRDYIDVPVRKPINKRQTQAYIGDWIVKQGRTFKVYPDKNFHQQFESKNGVVTQRPKGKSNPHKGVDRGKQGHPNPGQMPKKRPSGTPAPQPRVIKEAEIVELVEGSKDSNQEAPREDLGGLDIPAAETFTSGPHKATPEQVEVLREGLREKESELDDDELAAVGLPTSIQEGYKPVYRDEFEAELAITRAQATVTAEELDEAEIQANADDLEEKAEVLKEIEEEHDINQPAPTLEQYNEMVDQEEADAAEIQANVDAQLAQSPVDPDALEGNSEEALAAKAEAEQETDAAEVQAAVDAQLAQSPVDPQERLHPVRSGASEVVQADETVVELKSITLDELNSQAGDPRTAQEIMMEKNKA